MAFGNGALPRLHVESQRLRNVVLHWRLVFAEVAQAGGELSGWREMGLASKPSAVRQLTADKNAKQAVSMPATS